VLYTVHFTAFCLGGPFFPGHGVVLLASIGQSYDNAVPLVTNMLCEISC